MSSDFLPGKPFIELQQVESTNNYATGLAHAGMAQHGMVVFAHHQTAGKGQRNKQWQSDEGKNIALTIIIEPKDFALSESFLMSMAMAVGVYNFFKNYAGDETKIKWPNDIYWRDRKAAGILIENIIQGSQWKWCIAGIGININQTEFPELGSKAISLKQITGKNFEPLVLAKELCACLGDAYQQLRTSEKTIHPAYKEALFKLNETVVFKQGARIFPGVVHDVSTIGELILHTTLEERFQVGEIEWVI